MSSNVIPSAPHEESSLYPQLPPDFRMQKANEIEAALNAEVVHYRGVAKKYKRAKKIVNWSATGTGLLSFACSSASFSSALSVIGIQATIPLGGVGGAFALASSGLIVASKKLDSKIKKHREIVAIAIAKRDTVRRLYSKQCNIKMQRTANENAACLRRICKRSDQPKIEGIANNDARLILRKKLNGTTT